MRKFIGLLLFTSLMLIKVSGFHVYSHQDDDPETIENCNICDLALENQALDFQTPDDSYVVADIEFPQRHQQTLKDQQLKEQSFNYYLFSRPPPSPVV